MTQSLFCTFLQSNLSSLIVKYTYAFIVWFYILAFLSTGIQDAFASEQTAHFLLRPHCEKGYKDEENGTFGEVPHPGFVVEIGEGHCPLFEVEDPQTLKTPPLQEGDILDIDVVIQNPGTQPIASAKAWINYDPNILEGIQVDINETVFPLITPGEEDFFPREGYIKIGAESTLETRESHFWVQIARIQLRIKKTNPTGTVLSFYNVQQGGNTSINGVSDSGNTYIQGKEPGSLLVKFGTSLGEEESSNILDADEYILLEDDEIMESDSEEDEGGELEEDLRASAGKNCIVDGDCLSGTCFEGVCRESSFLIPTGGSCARDNQCASFNCENGICSSLRNLQEGEGCIDNTECASNLCIDGFCEQQRENRTAFSLLQIRNVQVSSEGTSVFLAWDALPSAFLQGYNVYYSTTSGQYIQRTSLPAEHANVHIRELPAGQRYFFAVRGVSTENQETTFSSEVSIVVGKPETASVPLSASLITSIPPSQNPVRRNLVKNGSEQESTTVIPGKTGLPPIFALLIGLSAILGTVLAAQRQLQSAHILHSHE